MFYRIIKSIAGRMSSPKSKLVLIYYAFRCKEAIEPAIDYFSNILPNTGRVDTGL